MPFAKYSVLDKNCLGAILGTIGSDTACLDAISCSLSSQKFRCHVVVYMSNLCHQTVFCCLFKHFLHLVGGPHLATDLCASLLCMKL